PSGWLAVLLLWVLFFWLYRDYRLDLFRQKLFALRDELFDVAAAGDVGFDSPAYGMLRSTINGTIQYGHQLGFLDLLLPLAFTKRGPIADKGISDFDRRWQLACNALNADAQAKLKSIRSRLHL